MSPAVDDAPWTTSANKKHGGESEMSHELHRTGFEHLAYRPGKKTPSFVGLSVSGEKRSACLKGSVIVRD